ncbi:helicase [Kockovaella imperatae]|uniref:Helicase n=1 Tax=Kockovaella imperatae TaxID=4999 RepID=A0A1Y1UTN8_9TREE|nr:helicase [Kockovaella imperatae]ORX40977.1 helicase [Kockovaella imperatae]
MNGPSNLNHSITAAWSVASVPSTSSNPNPGSSTANVAQKRRVKRTVGLNSPARVGSPDPSDPAAANGDSRPATPPNPAKRRKPRNDLSQISAKYAPPDLKLASLGGLRDQITQLMEIVALPLMHPELYSQTGISRPRGVLLHGVPGGGKTQLVRCLAGELGLPFINVSAPSIVSGMSGESEKTLRDKFEEAKTIAPCLMFLDEVDAITPKRETAQREMERRIVAQLLTCMDDLAASVEPVVIIGATNRPDALDPALRRAGRFDHEIEMGVPSIEGREEILRVLCRDLRLSDETDFRDLAKRTPGYVGADLTALVTEAGVIAVKRIFEEIGTGQLSLPEPNGVENMAIDDGPFSTLPSDLRDTPIARFLASYPSPLTTEQLESVSVQTSDFDSALKIVQPSAKREGFATIPDVTWNDIGALATVRDELHMAIVQPIRHPELFSVVGIDAPSGVLLWGPPGCGKTLLAKAVANESRANFISVKGPELLNKYVGESERAVRQVFARARASSPCVIFFDELDALVPRRDDSMSESSARVVNTLLTELDGLDARKAVYVIGATNRPDMIDPAMARPGRLDKLLYVDLPSPEERFEILKTHTTRTPIDDAAWSGIQTMLLGDGCEGYSGADIAALVREAATLALRSALESFRAFESDRMDGPIDTSHVRVDADHFARAVKKTLPSVSKEQRVKYERMRDKYAGIPTKGRRMREERELDAAGPSLEPSAPAASMV